MSSFDETDAFEGASLSARAMAARPRPYLDGLNPAQREAVEMMDGPVLMLAGAGTGKTRALTARIVHLLNTGRARPNEILAVTFTNKAAREMKNRVGQMLGQPVEGMPWLGTFHAICVKLLRRHAELVGLKSNFTILDTDDQLRLLKQLVTAEGIDDKRWPARLLANIIDGWKNRALMPDKLPAADAGAYNHKGAKLYAQYQLRLKELNACDFGDLLLHMVTIFQNNPDVLAQYQRWFAYILVDEYQDTNVAQYLWLRLLAGGHKNICCVGDDDQSIYGWRGAEVGNILKFEKDFHGAHVVRLEQNYRSTPHILAAASSVIEGNKGRLGKTLFTDLTEGKKVKLTGHWDGEEEARWISDQIEDAVAGRGLYRDRLNLRSMGIYDELVRQVGKDIRRWTRQNFVNWAIKTKKAFLDPRVEKLVRELLEKNSNSEKRFLSIMDSPLDRFGANEVAILVRASHQMRAFEDRFLTIGLPYRVIGGPRFYERMEIRDAMAYFRVVVSPDDDLAFERIVNTPKRGLGPKKIQEIFEASRTNKTNLINGARLAVQSGKIKGEVGRGLMLLLDKFHRWRRMATDPDVGHVELAQMILEETGYIASYFLPQTDDEIKRGADPKYKDIEAEGRLENLKELVSSLDRYENLQGFLEDVALSLDNDKDDNVPKISIMTLHAAKGLEFPVVFLPGWEDGLFPSQRSMDESGVKGLEEERRLAYVGITRAEEVCTISFVANRRVFGQWQNALPSRFIDELDEAHVEVLTPPGLYGGGYGAAAPRSTLHDQAAEANVYNSPGWRRLQARSQNRPISQPREAKNTVIDASAVSSFVMGERVFHQKFGYGAIQGIEGDKLEIAFEKAGVKKVVAKFVTGCDDIPF